MASGFYIDRYHRKRYPPSLLRAYHNISILFGMILGYIVSTALIWSDIEELTSGEFIGMPTNTQEFSVVRIGIFVVFYLFMNFLGMLTDEYKVSYKEKIIGKDRKMLIKENLKGIGKLLAIFAICLVVIYFIKFQGNFCWVFGGIIFFFVIIILYPFAVELMVLLEK
jgi:hypothetical protein